MLCHQAVIFPVASGLCLNVFAQHKSAVLAVKYYMLIRHDRHAYGEV